jgi:hypothetical protein
MKPVPCGLDESRMGTLECIFYQVDKLPRLKNKSLNLILSKHA